MADAGEMFGLGQEGAAQVKTVIGGGLGAAFLVYLRHPGTLLKAGILFELGMGSGSIFGPIVHDLIAFNLAASGAMAALCSLPVASGILRALEKLDFAAMLPGKKGDV